MGSGTSKVDQKMQGLEEELEKLKEFMREQQKTGETSSEAFKRMEEAIARAESMAREQQEAMRRLEEQIRRANEGRARGEAGAQRALEQERHARQAERDAEQMADAARRATTDAERQRLAGEQPLASPTLAQREAAKRKIGYEDGLFHFAVAGVSGSGKSSLINALRGLRNKDRGAAPTGVVETTDEIVRYHDPQADRSYVWYDVPGAGTLSVPDWQYFTDMGLYVFDCIIVVCDNRFTQTDVAILRNCLRFQIPTLVTTWGGVGDDDEDEDDEDVGERRKRARERYIQGTHQVVERDLQAAGLPPQHVYLVDKDVLLKIVRGRQAKGRIDEKELLRRIFELAPPQIDGSELESTTSMDLSDQWTDFGVQSTRSPLITLGPRPDSDMTLSPWMDSPSKV
ncbi:hypothetical protein EVJ58_g6836 [Rhodofomes roseus]|uniref:IRG-type G domain-containing protein n=1 Tax=Rhodofomes roseus TaxID=34475 RepID=A0A4Y9Y783_9APHY|nr:hypothetical protein EVJ58_g6836 [Rhodofomes roseus]